MEELIKKAAIMSLNNRTQVVKSNKCGCYYCCSIFNAEDVIFFVDEGTTALCPKCGVDAVIPDSIIVDLNYMLLEELKKYWF